MPYRPVRLAALVLLACLGIMLTGCATATDAPSTRTRATATVGASELPAEARETLRLIDRGGPFPYEKDGAVFGNFEGRLPKRERGHYREYTVPTPGESDRGARRIVTGRDGEIYYTDDHYETFREVLR
ncbi:ribonuclease domain-containing protein [Streptomyces sp. NPDC000410]|uniref:ribonuclease domain-containing protein n=1 Tax=Streptomyces sp. NPDC000410 TaxID=3154254 RepID=UPI00331B07EA